MSKMQNILLSRAKVLGEKRYVVGNYLKEYFHPVLLKRFQHVIFTSSTEFEEIDEKTLAISINNGEMFYALNITGKGGDVFLDDDFEHYYAILYEGEFQFRYIYNNKVGARFVPGNLELNKIGINELNIFTLKDGNTTIEYNEDFEWEDQNLMLFQ